VLQAAPDERFAMQVMADRARLLPQGTPAGDVRLALSVAHAGSRVTGTVGGGVARTVGSDVTVGRSAAAFRACRRHHVTAD